MRPNQGGGKEGRTYPDVAEHGAVGALAVTAKVLRNDSSDGHGDADKAVLVDADPDDVEPSQAAGRHAPGSTLAATAFLKPVDGSHPLLDAPEIAEVVLLVVEVRSNVGAEEGKEGGDRKGFVTVAYYLKIDRVPVEAEGQERGGSVDRNHEENADDAGDNALAEAGREAEADIGRGRKDVLALLLGLGVVQGMHPNKIQAHDNSNQGRGTGDDQGEVVEGQRASDLQLRRGQDCEMVLARWRAVESGGRKSRDGW